MFSIGPESWGISTYWMPSALLPRELTAPGPVENLVRTLADSAGITLEYDWRAFSAIGADIGDADILGVPAGSPCWSARASAAPPTASRCSMSAGASRENAPASY